MTCHESRTDVSGNVDVNTLRVHKNMKSYLLEKIR